MNIEAVKVLNQYKLSVYGSYLNSISCLKTNKQNRTVKQ